MCSLSGGCQVSVFTEWRLFQTRGGDERERGVVVVSD